ncbi:unnamed protein product, partial [Adineta ricciae]
MMDQTILSPLLAILIFCISYSSTHSASSSSALATSSLKFKNPRLDKDKLHIGRKNKFTDDDDDDYETKLRNHSDEARLRLILLDGYVPQARPVVNTTNATIVDVGLTII